MALREFWTHVRVAADLVSWTGATVDAPRLDASRIERILRESHSWLMPRVVEGFDEHDFDFLSEEGRRSLQESVRGFLRVAERVPDDAGPSPQQVQDALPYFRRIIELLRPDKYADPDALILGERIEQFVEGRLPTWVREMVFETGNDANGEPALWIWVEIDDTAAAEDVFSQNTKSIRTILERAVRKVAIDRWPYIRFRTTSEQRTASK
jgi:hypothetical protein